MLFGEIRLILTTLCRFKYVEAAAAKKAKEEAEKKAKEEAEKKVKEEAAALKKAQEEAEKKVADGTLLRLIVPIQSSLFSLFSINTWMGVQRPPPLKLPLKWHKRKLRRKLLKVRFSY